MSIAFASVCCHVVMLSCLYVVGRHSLVLTDLRLKGACNQGKKVFNFYCVSSMALRHLCYWRECSPVELKIIIVMFSRKKTLETLWNQGLSEKSIKLDLFLTINKIRHQLKYDDYHQEQ